MSNLEKYDKIFMQNLRVTKDKLPGLKYRDIPLWDSLGHMDMISEMEEVFDIRISTADVMDFSSYETGKEVLARYGVEIK